MGKTFKLVNASDYYEYDDQYQVWKDKTDNADYMKKLVEDGENVKIVGIVQSAEDAKASSLTPGINYTSDLVNHVAEQAKSSEIVKQQLANPNVNVFTGEEFGNTDGNNGFDMNSLFSIDEDALKNAFGFDSSAMNNLGSSMDLSGLDLSKAFQMDGNSMDLSGMVNLDQVEINMDNMPQMNLGDILTNLDVQVNADSMQKMLISLSEGYQEYVKNHPEADYSNLGNQIAEYLTSDQAKAIIQKYLKDILKNNGEVTITPEQIKDEISSVVDLIFSTYKDFGITNYRCVLSLRDPENKTKYHDDDEMWNKAENALRDVMNSLGIEYTEEIGEAAFYGPKLDVNVKPAVGNEITLSTCQLDFCLPAKFNLSYVDKDGEKKTPVVLHRAILGSLDRFMAYILEETKGNLPTWLAPVQVKVMPVKTDNEELMEYARQICENLEDRNVRVELDDRAEKLGYRMREGQVQKVPYLLVIGFNEMENKSVSYRLHGEMDTTTVGLDEFVEKIHEEIKNKVR